MATPKVIVNAWISADLYQQVELASRKQGITLSQWLRDAMAMKLQFEKFQQQQRNEEASTKLDKTISDIIDII